MEDSCWLSQESLLSGGKNGLNDEFHDEVLSLLAAQLQDLVSEHSSVNTGDTQPFLVSSAELENCSFLTLKLPRGGSPKCFLLHVISSPK